MRKYNALLLSAMVLASIVLVSSCKDDDPPVPPNLSFESAETTAIESDANVLIELTLDKAAPEDITIEYTLSGTAIDRAKVSANAPFDYEIVSEYGEVTIAKGETTGSIEIDLASDLNLEDDETIILKIDNVSTDAVLITRDDESTVIITQEDGKGILLEWPGPSANGQADMDMILRYGSNTTTWGGILDGSVSESFEGSEFLFIPNAANDPAYGLSYVYYDGTLDPLEFTVTFADFVDGTFEAEANWDVYNGTYTIVNKNTWTDVSTTKVVQTFESLEGGGFTTPSEIMVPDAGSRAPSSGTITTTLKKGTPSKHTRAVLPSLLKK